MKLNLPNSFQELCAFECKEPIFIDIYYVDRKQKAVHFRWDFGLTTSIKLDTFVSKDAKGLKNKILKEIIFDIGHAFCHCEEDPNYTDYHWALAGWLKDRLTIDKQ